MGLSVLDIEIGNIANPDVTERVCLLVDSGTTYSVVPALILEKLGIKPISQHTFRLPDGSTLVRHKGCALYRYGTAIGGADVIFGEEGDCQLLGAFTLTALGLALNPIKRELMPLTMILGGLDPKVCQIR